MPSQIYFYPDLRKKLIAEVKSFSETVEIKIFPLFQNIDQEAEQYAQKLYGQTMESIGDPDADASAIADAAIDEGARVYESLRMIRNSFVAQSFSNLFQFWEQQTREFLFDEISHSVEVDPAKFCSNGLDDMKKIFSDHGLDIQTLASWPLLNELRLISNIVKHGDGPSATKLKAIKPGFIGKSRSGKVSTSLVTSESLILSEGDFKGHGGNLALFWEEFPERSIAK